MHQTHHRQGDIGREVTVPTLHPAEQLELRIGRFGTVGYLRLKSVHLCAFSRHYAALVTSSSLRGRSYSQTFLGLGT